MIQDMLDSMNDHLEIPSEKISRCPKCGWKMVPWVQDNTFLQGEHWKTAYQQYTDFLNTYKNTLSL